MLIKTTLSVP